MVLAVLAMVEVAEGVLEPSDHLGIHPDSFLFKIDHETLFKLSFLAKAHLLVLYHEIDFEDVIEVL